MGQANAVDPTSVEGSFFLVFEECRGIECGSLPPGFNQRQNLTHRISLFIAEAFRSSDGDINSCLFPARSLSHIKYHICLYPMTDVGRPIYPYIHWYLHAN